MYNSIRPGQVWLDTEGKRIQAHGGSVIYDNGTYYWYGENKEKTDGVSDILIWGVRMYASKDLYNWEDLGNIIPPNLDDPTSPVHPHSKMDRPHIIYNPRTKKWVCWMKIMEPDGRQTASVMIADKLTGPYTLVRTGLMPLGMSAGDFDLVVAPDGKGYYYFERVHSETICADLTDDFTNVTGHYSTHFPRPYPPFVREACAHFVRNHKHYLITSGTTSYLPNPSEVAIGDTWHGPFTVLGDPCPNDESRTTYHCQVSSVFKVQGKKDLYIAVGDRWLPGYMDLDYEQYAKAFQAGFDPNADEEFKKKYPMPHFVKNTGISDYVWLPIRFDGEMAYLDWHDEWRIEDYD